ncbi:MAG: O-methyltransferase [Thermoplasmata archaeon]
MIPIASAVPDRRGRTERARPVLLRPAARKAIVRRMLLVRHAALARLSGLTGVPSAELLTYRHELTADGTLEQILDRGAGAPFVSELPQGVLLYLLVRALKPRRIVETGMRPGYSTAWLLAGLKANGTGELTSLGPGSGVGRSPGVEKVGVGQFVAPSLRAAWTLELGTTPGHLDRVLASGGPAEMIFLDNGPDAERTRGEIRAAWRALAPGGLLLAHRVAASTVWEQFCRQQGLTPQILDAGPPPMGALSLRPS